MNRNLRKTGMSIAGLVAAGALLAACSSSDDDPAKADLSSAVTTVTSIADDVTSVAKEAGDDVAQSWESLDTEKLTTVDGDEIEVIKPIVDKYNELGGERGHLGQAVGEQERVKDDGAWLEFTNGLIVWSADTDAHYLSGEAAAAFIDSGGVAELGFPTEDMTDEDGVQEVKLQNGKITVTDGVAEVEKN